MAYGGAADDRHDAARAEDTGENRSLQRRVHPDGVSAGEREPDGIDPPRAAEGQGDQRLWHYGGRPRGVRAASERIEAAGQFRRLQASEGPASPGRRQEQEGRPGRAGDEMPGADEWLP